MKAAENLMELIGRTPLLRMDRFARQNGLDLTLLGKLEMMNPGGSVKDRTGMAMIEAAEEQGLLQPGNVIVEPTSGNTGVALATVAAIKGYSLVLTMPETMSMERRNLLAALGARLVLTPAEDGMNGAIREAGRILADTPGAFMPQQFNNPANVDIHRRTTAREILEDTDGAVDLFVSGVGTGGTVSGVGQILKEHNPLVQVVAVEPKESAVLSGQPLGFHRIQGIGAGFVPEIMDMDVVDEILPVSSDDAFAQARAVARAEGLLVGISSGAVLAAALEVGRRPENRGKNMVVLLPDGGERYLSTPLFEE